MNADEDFFADTLGIIGDVEKDKLRFELSKVQNTQIGESKLYGWGNNKLG